MINKKTLYITIALLLIIIFLIIYNPANYRQVCINNICFNIELAETSEERTKGLMYRSSLNQENAMFFLFQKEAIYPFWMKNTIIPLDIIWINKNKEVVYIMHNALPCEEECLSIIPPEKALYVLEINANLSEKYNFNIGDKIEF